jgi:hypothetical protein
VLWEKSSEREGLKEVRRKDRILTASFFLAACVPFFFAGPSIEASVGQVYVYIFKGEAFYSLDGSRAAVGKEGYLRIGGRLSLEERTRARVLYDNGKYYDIEGPALVEIAERQVLTPRRFAGRRAQMLLEASNPGKVSIGLGREGIDGQDEIDTLLSREALYRERVGALVNEKDRLRQTMDRLSETEERYSDDLKWQYREIEKQIHQLDLAIVGIRSTIMDKLREKRKRQLEKEESL